MKSNYVTLFSVWVLLLIFLVLVFDLSLLSAVNYFLSGIIFFRFVNRLGKEIPIKELTSFVLILQMIITPLITYQVYDNNIGYPMDIPEDLYMLLITPLVYAFVFGLYFPLSKRKINLNSLFGQVDQYQLVRVGWAFTVIGFFANITMSFFPVSLKFVITIVSYFQFLGVFCLFFSKDPNRNIAVIFIYGFFFLNAIRTGMFYGLIVWGFFLLALFFIRFKVSTVFKLSVLTIGFVSLVVLQAVKRDFREAIKKDSKVNRIEQLYSNIDQKIESDAITKEEGGVGAFIKRVNTGHITAKVFKHTPARQPFSNGKELSEDLIATLLPRFLFPNKKAVGGEDNKKKFFKYTGRILNEETIMRIGVIGDAYINFGLLGGALLLFVFGLVLNFLLAWIYRISNKFPLMILWIPVLFTYIVRMSDFIVLINSLVKILFVLFVVKIIFPQSFLPIKKIKA